MTPQPKFQVSDRAICTDDSDTHGQIVAGQVYYVFGVTHTAPQHLRLNNGFPAIVWSADRFDRMRPAHLLK